MKRLLEKVFSSLKTAILKSSPVRKSIATFLAGVVVFVTTYALILPALTLEQDNAEDIGLFCENPEDNNLEYTSPEKDIFISTDVEEPGIVDYVYDENGLTGELVSDETGLSSDVDNSTADDGELFISDIMLWTGDGESDLSDAVIEEEQGKPEQGEFAVEEQSYTEYEEAPCISLDYNETENAIDGKDNMSLIEPDDEAVPDVLLDKNFYYEASKDDLWVRIYSSVDAFHEDVSLTLTEADDDSIELISSAVIKNLLTTEEIKVIRAVDISFRDNEGNEIEPAEPVKVVLRQSDIAALDSDTEDCSTIIAHLLGDGTVEIIDQEAADEEEDVQPGFDTEDEYADTQNLPVDPIGFIPEEQDVPIEEEQNIPIGVEEQDVLTEEENIPVEEDQEDTVEEVTVFEEENAGYDLQENGQNEDEMTEEPELQFMADSFSVYALITIGKIPETEVINELPAQIFTGFTDKLAVNVYASVGAFPEGTTMSVKDISDTQTIDSISEAVGMTGLQELNIFNDDEADYMTADYVANSQTETDAKQTVKSVLAVDISFYDADGNEIEPACPVKVVLTPIDTELSSDASVVVHMDNEGQTQIIEQEELDPEKWIQENMSEQEVSPAIAYEPAVVSADELIVEESVDDRNIVEKDQGAVIATVPEKAMINTTESVAFEADSFSIYAVVIIVNEDGTRTLVAEGKDYIVKIMVGPGADIPEDTLLEVNEIPSGSEVWNSYYKQILEEVQRNDPVPERIELRSVRKGECSVEEESVKGNSETLIFNVRLYDIKLIYNNCVVEPDESVKVSIIYNNPIPIRDGEIPSVAHFSEDGLEMIEPEVIAANPETRNIKSYVFEQASFSITGTFTRATGFAQLENEGKYLILNHGTGSDGHSYYRVLSADPARNYTILANGNDAISQVAQECDDTCVWTLYVYTYWDSKQNSYAHSYGLFNEETKKWLSLNGNSNTQDSLISDTLVGLILHDLENNGRFRINNYYDGHDLGILNSENQIFVNKDADYNTSNKFEFHRILPLEIDEDGPVPQPKQPNTEMLARWKEELDRSEAVRDTSKTAEVYDYDNRIYRIDLTAKSGYRALDQNIELAFITDVSNSMLFASSLTSTGTYYSYTNNNTIKGNVSGFTDKNQVYIIIGDPSSESTHYAVWWERTDMLGNGAWKAVDASYYAKRKYWELTGIELKDNKNRSPSDWWDGSRTPKDLSKEAYNSAATSGNLRFVAGVNYPIYVPTDNKWLLGFSDIFSVDNSAENRLFYLKQNVAAAVDALKLVAGTSEDMSVRVALETFAKDIPDTSGFDFKDVVSITDIESDLNDITTADGTNQRYAIECFGTGINGHDYAKNWSTSDGKKKVVILISDGAPNVKEINGKYLKTNTKNVRDASKTLEDKGAEVYSVALSMGDVDYGKRIMAAAATDADHFYMAENENEFQYVFYDILYKLIANATVRGKVEDTIDKVFYPVDKNGNIIPDGSFITLKGELIAKPSGAGYIDANGNTAVPPNTNTDTCGKIVRRSDGTYNVTWYNQDFTWDGWHGTVYVKSKEDFLGGNAINTNVGEAVVTPEKYYVSYGTDGNPILSSFPAGKDRAKELPTPYVNVDELALSHESTEWTVYLGNTVDPLTQLKDFYDDIKVLEVVTGTTTEHLKNGDMLYEQNFEPDTGDASNDTRQPKVNTGPEAFPLKDVVKECVIVSGKNEDAAVLSQNYIGADGSITDEGWKQLLSGGSIYLKYSDYGHIPGVIELSLSKEHISPEPLLTDGTYDTEKGGVGHQTTLKGEKVETYTLTAEYTAYTKTVSDYHTGQYSTGSPGIKTDTMTSVNEHIINVFALPLEIEKQDLFDSDLKLEGVTFKLLKPRKSGEQKAQLTDEEKGQLESAGYDADSDYSVYATLVTDKNGQGKIDTVETLPDDEVYYLVESSTKSGYSLLLQAITVKLQVDKTYSDVRKEAVVNGTANKTDWAALLEEKATPQNMIENAALSMLNVAMNNYFEGDSSTGEYVIKNSVAVSLPSTGGSGTRYPYILGALLTVLTAIGLVMTRRKGSFVGRFL